MTRYGGAVVSLAVSLGSIVGYFVFLHVPTVRNHPAGGAEIALTLKRSAP